MIGKSTERRLHALAQVVTDSIADANELRARLTKLEEMQQEWTWRVQAHIEGTDVMVPWEHLYHAERKHAIANEQLVKELTGHLRDLAQRIGSFAERLRETPLTPGEARIVEKLSEELRHGTQ